MVRRQTEKCKRRREEEEEEELFAVEHIVDKRVNTYGQTEYLVKWFGYEESENTWEPKESLTKSCRRLLWLYEASRTPNAVPAVPRQSTPQTVPVDENERTEASTHNSGEAAEASSSAASTN
ncbi:Chromo domain containing protein [Aphelenchoides avenae]|nr:Chromo domain containing protein [Aphelenchus avenae]